VTAAACGVSAVNTAKLDRLVLRRDGVSGSDSSTAEPETRRLRRVGVKDASSSNICIFLTDFAGVFLGVLPGVSNGVLGVEPPRALRWGVSWDSNSFCGVACFAGRPLLADKGTDGEIAESTVFDDFLADLGAGDESSSTFDDFLVDLGAGDESPSTFDDFLVDLGAGDESSSTFDDFLVDLGAGDESPSTFDDFLVDLGAGDESV